MKQQRTSRRRPAEIAACQQEPSPLSSLPFYPNLRQLLKSAVAALLLTYFEIHHPAPQVSVERVSSLPVTVDLDKIALDLQLTRRTLRLTLSQVSVWVRTEEERLAAARAGREFYKPSHTRYGKTKPYSIVGRNADSPGIQLHIRRNVRHLTGLMERAGIAAFGTTSADSPTADLKLPNAHVSVTPPPTLAEIMLQASALNENRRQTRYVRAVDGGLYYAHELRIAEKKLKQR